MEKTISNRALNKALFWRGHQILIQSPYNWRPSISTRRVSPTSFFPFLWSARSIPNRRRSTRLAAAAAIPLAVAGDPLPPPVESPPWPDPPHWGTDCRLGAETATGRAGPGRHRAWPGRRCLAASPATGALPGRPRLPRHPRNAARHSWHPHDRQVLLPAASYLARTSTLGLILSASGHARSPMSRLHPAPSCLASSSNRFHPAPSCLLPCAMKHHIAALSSPAPAGRPKRQASPSQHSFRRTKSRRCQWKQPPPPRTPEEPPQRLTTATTLAPPRCNCMTGVLP